jgi:hypothetical protein
MARRHVMPGREIHTVGPPRPTTGLPATGPMATARIPTTATTRIAQTTTSDPASAPSTTIADRSGNHSTGRMVLPVTGPTRPAAMENNVPTHPGNLIITDPTLLAISNAPAIRINLRAVVPALTTVHSSSPMTGDTLAMGASALMTGSKMRALNGDTMGTLSVVPNRGTFARTRTATRHARRDRALYAHHSGTNRIGKTSLMDEIRQATRHHRPNGSRAITNVSAMTMGARSGEEETQQRARNALSKLPHKRQNVM